MMKHGFFGVTILMAVLTLAGCDSQEIVRPSPVKQAADGLIGKPLDVAIEAFGPPSLGPPSSVVSGSYLWNHTAFNPSKLVAAQRLVGERIVGVTQAGNGVASRPVYQSQYETDYEWQQSISYFCTILVVVDAQGIITSAKVAGCQKTPHGY